MVNQSTRFIMNTTGAEGPEASHHLLHPLVHRPLLDTAIPPAQAMLARAKSKAMFIHQAYGTTEVQALVALLDQTGGAGGVLVCWTDPSQEAIKFTARKRTAPEALETKEASCLCSAHSFCHKGRLNYSVATADSKALFREGLLRDLPVRFSLLC